MQRINMLRGRTLEKLSNDVFIKTLIELENMIETDWNYDRKLDAIELYVELLSVGTDLEAQNGKQTGETTKKTKAAPRKTRSNKKERWS